MKYVDQILYNKLANILRNPLFPLCRNRYMRNFLDLYQYIVVPIYNFKKVHAVA